MKDSGVTFKLHPTLPNIEVSNTGSIRNTKTGTVYSKWINKSGYQLISISQKGKNHHYQVHRMVMETFKGFSSLNVNHLDFNKENNNLNNLEYVTQADNIKHSKQAGHMIGHQTNTKLNFVQATEIRELWSMGNKQKDIAKIYNVSPQTVNDIIKYRTWKEDLI